MPASVGATPVGALFHSLSPAARSADGGRAQGEGGARAAGVCAASNQIPWHLYISSPAYLAGDVLIPKSKALNSSKIFTKSLASAARGASSGKRDKTFPRPRRAQRGLGERGWGEGVPRCVSSAAGVLCTGHIFATRICRIAAAMRRTPSLPSPSDQPLRGRRGRGDELLQERGQQWHRMNIKPELSANLFLLQKYSIYMYFIAGFSCRR